MSIDCYTSVYDSQRLRNIPDILYEVYSNGNISNELKPDVVRWLEREIFILALTDNYNISDYTIDSIRTNWKEANFDSTNILLDPNTNHIALRPITKGFIISNNSLNKRLCVHINNTTLLGYNKRDLLSSGVRATAPVIRDYVRFAVLNHIRNNVVINEAINQLRDAVNIMKNEYFNNPNLTRQSCCDFMEDPRITTQIMFSTVRFTFRNYTEATEMLKQVLIVKHANDFSSDDWINEGLAYPSLYDYAEAVILNSINN